MAKIKLKQLATNRKRPCVVCQYVHQRQVEPYIAESCHGKGRSLSTVTAGAFMGGSAEGIRLSLLPVTSL